MFKKTKIAAAVLAIAATSTTQAVHIDANGTGQVLLFPYYNVNEAFQTSFNITNTTNKFKAIKIRLRESRDSNDVLDYNVYMSPWDQYTATIKSVGGKPVLTSADTSCTFPSAPQQFLNGVELRNVYADVTNADLTEGYIEVIEMGDISETALTNEPLPLANGVENNITAGLKHVNGVPKDCGVVTRAWDNQGFTQGVLMNGMAANPVGYNNGLVAPSGGLSGFSILLQVTTGAAFVADATAIDDYSNTPQHFLPHDKVTYLLPSLASGDVQNSTITPESNSTAPTSITVNNWPLTRFDTGLVDNLGREDLNQVPAGANPFPMAAALAATGFSNDYFIEPSLEGGTDWVITLPMKKHGIYNGLTLDENTDGNNTSCNPNNMTLGTAGTGGIVTHSFDKVPTSGAAQCKTGFVTGTGATNAPGEYIGYTGTTSEVTADFRYWDREESEPTTPPSGSDFSPPKLGAPTGDSIINLTREVNVNSFALDGSSTNVSSALGTPPENLISYPVLEYPAGWAKLTYTAGYNLATNSDIDKLSARDIITNGESIDGIPSIGFAAIKAVVSGNKAGETVPHVRYIDNSKFN